MDGIMLSDATEIKKVDRLRRRQPGCFLSVPMAEFLRFMSAFRCTLIGRVCFLAALLGPPAAPACNVPVFRYALERWNPDAFVAVVFHREPLTAAPQALVEAMARTSDDGAANWIVRKADVSRTMSPAFQALWQSQAKATTPWLVVRYPAGRGIEQSVWLL